MSAPQIMRINHDDYHAKYVGRTADGRQFFLTAPFVPLGHEFVALYLFDASGELLEAQIDDLGTRAQLDAVLHRATFESRLQELGEVTFCDIAVAPFRVERFGVEFGLIAEVPEDGGEVCWVTVEPGDFMVFYPPWDGNYDT